MASLQDQDESSKELRHTYQNWLSLKYQGIHEHKFSPAIPKKERRLHSPIANGSLKPQIRPYDDDEPCSAANQCIKRNNLQCLEPLNEEAAKKR